MQPTPITAIIVGAGHRSIGYADITFSHPDLLRIVVCVCNCVLGFCLNGK